MARVRSTDGKFIFSGSFNVERGVIQGDIVSPVLFIMTLDQLVQEFDTTGEVVKCDRILDIRVLGYADDAALVERHVDSMTTRLTNLGIASRDRVDMSMNMSKTFTHHVHRRDSKPAATKAAAMKIQSKYSHQCEFCPRKFKTARAAKIHQVNCVHNYGMTTEYYELEKICDVFGHQAARWFLVKWKGYDTPEWELEHLLRKDGCHVWTTYGLKPNREFYPDPEGRHRCTICCKTYKRAQYLRFKGSSHKRMTLQP